MKLLVVTVRVASLAALGTQRQRQGRGRQAPVPPGLAADPGVTPAEIQRMFDAYALVQAQDQLQLSDEQYARFLVRFKALQDIRRRSLQEHTRLVADLRRLLARQGQPDEAQLKDRMQALQDVDSRASRRRQEGLRGDRSVARREAAGQLPCVRGADGAPEARAHHARPPGEPSKTATATATPQ